MSIGPNPVLSKDLATAWENLASKLTHRSKGGSTKVVDGDGEEEDDSDSIELDVFASKHSILKEGDLQKRSQNSIVSHTSHRRCFLLNDAFLITKVPSSKLSLSMMKSENLEIKQVFQLSQISVMDLCNHGDENKSAFELITAKRGYIFVTDSVAEKVAWLEQFRLAIISTHLGSPRALLPGWQHTYIRGSLYAAALEGDESLVDYHLSNLNGSAPNFVDDSGMSAIHWAALRGHTTIIDKIYNAGGDLDILNSGLNSALHIAASQGHNATVQYLLDRGADIRSRNLRDRDALFMSVLYCRREKKLGDVLRVEFSRGVDANQFDSSDTAPIHECAARSLAMPIKYLVDERADVNLKHRRSGLLPIQIACSLSVPNAEVVRALIENGSIVNIVDSDGNTPFASILKQYLVSLDNSTYSRDKMIDTFLAALKELAKGGARFLEADLRNLRDSFRASIIAARDHWVNLTVPDFFTEYKESKHDLLAPKEDWESDSSSPSCPLCCTKFTVSTRRHHCRSCGKLACAVCSTKKLYLADSSVKSSGPNGERVCDPCFNKHMYEAKKFQSWKAKKTNGTVFTTDSSSGPVTVSSATQEALNAMHKRGAAIEAAAESADKMEAGAQDFKKMTKELLRQQQQEQQKGGWK